MSEKEIGADGYPDADVSGVPWQEAAGGHIPGPPAQSSGPYRVSPGWSGQTGWSAPQSPRKRRTVSLVAALSGVAAAAVVGSGLGLLVGRDNAPAGPGRVPQTCLAALDDADAGFTVAADAMGVYGDAFDAIRDLDPSSMDTALAKMDSLTAELGPISERYLDNKDACREAAR